LKETFGFEAAMVTLATCACHWSLNPKSSLERWLCP
jgi:hypothetical protein